MLLREQLSKEMVLKSSTNSGLFLLGIRAIRDELMLEKSMELLLKSLKSLKILLNNVPTLSDEQAIKTI